MSDGGVCRAPLASPGLLNTYYLSQRPPHGSCLPDTMYSPFPTMFINCTKNPKIQYTIHSSQSIAHNTQYNLLSTHHICMVLLSTESYAFCRSRKARCGVLLSAEDFHSTVLRMKPQSRPDLPFRKPFCTSPSSLCASTTFVSLAFSNLEYRAATLLSGALMNLQVT